MEVTVTARYLGGSMEALVWVGPRKMALQEEPLPSIEADEALIRVAYCGICGSELSGYLGHNALRKPPLVMGHEFSGEVVALGAAVRAEHPELEVGARVTANPMIFDGTCRYCKDGLPHLCADRALIGAHRPGAFADYVAVPASQLFGLPSDMDLRTGALSEPVACSVRIARLASGVGGAAVLIVGSGAIGLFTLQVLRDKGARQVFVSDTNPARLSVAAALGAKTLNPQEVDVVEVVLRATGSEGVDISVDAVGKAVTRAQCVGATRRSGQVLLSGLHEEVSVMPVADLIRKELKIQGTFCYTPDDIREALQLLARGAVVGGSWVVEAALAEGGDWFARLIDGPGEAVKVLLRPSVALDTLEVGRR